MSLLSPRTYSTDLPVARVIIPWVVLVQSDLRQIFLPDALTSLVVHVGRGRKTTGLSGVFPRI